VPKRNTARQGNSFENVVGRSLEDRGWLVGSRRHRKGGGDWLAVSLELELFWLVECKATKGMWDHFGPADRQMLAEAADRHSTSEQRVAPILAFRLPGNRIRWVPKKSWPGEEIA
jgi:hypothetical protein